MKLHKILLCLAILTLASCDRDKDLTDKTPLTVTALLDVNSRAEQTRAADKEFADGDQMVFYLRHVIWNGGFTTADADKRESQTADQAPRLITLTCIDGSQDWNETIQDILPFDAVNNVEINKDNTKQAARLQASYTNTSGTTTTGLYWDDFSETDAAKNLHTANHYLQSYYGYCYNGGTPVSGTELDADDKKAAGQIGWAVQTDQTSADNFKHSDLLWSAEQTPIRYDHKATIDDITRAGIIIPYTHAMSKVTINVIAGDGFDDYYDFNGTKVTLDKVRTSCTATAPTATLTYPGKDDASAKDDVIMQPGTGTGTRSFQAIIVPSVLTVGNKLASITGMDGNEYFIYVTDNIINGWTTQLTDTDEDIHNGTAQVSPRMRVDDAQIPGGKGHQMKSGVHYILNVTVNKTEVTVSAAILDWNEVTAEGVGEIHFSNDVAEKGTIADSLKLHGFDIFKSTTTTFGAKATTVRWNKANNEWRYNPAIYWNGVPEYFRALWNARTDAPGTVDNESLHMENGRDVLWGTTKAHSGTDADGQAYDYAEGAAIKPRTGDVPLLFYHAMAKITFNLEDAAKGSSNDDSKLDLSRATIQLTNLATGGTINLNDGLIPAGQLDAITSGQKAFSEDNGAVPKRMGYYAAKENGIATSYNASLTLKDYYVIPQDITDNAILIITLANGTTYRTKLNFCRAQNGVDGAGQAAYTYVTQWERGKHYVYTITLAKDTIEFRAEIKEWEEVEASGTITPEW